MCYNLSKNIHENIVPDFEDENVYLYIVRKSVLITYSYKISIWGSIN